MTTTRKAQSELVKYESNMDFVILVRRLQDQSGHKVIQPLEFQSHIQFDSHLLFVQVTFISATREENKLCVTSLSISFLFTLLSVTPGAPPP